TVVAIVDRKIDLQDANLQCVAGLRAVNEDRPSKDVSRRAAILDFAVNGTLVFRHNARQHGTGLVDLYRVKRGRGLDRDDVNRTSFAGNHGNSTKELMRRRPGLRCALLDHHRQTLKPQLPDSAAIDRREIWIADVRFRKARQQPRYRDAD